jgi:hypothetical protein
MHHEGKRLAVHFVDDTVEALGFQVAVGRVPERAEDEGARGNRRRAGAGADQEKEK